ncbi:MAG: L,D-transpeptidase [Polyangiaceae bacterium]
MRTFASLPLHHATWLAALALVACSGPAAERGPETPKTPAADVTASEPAPAAPEATAEPEASAPVEETKEPEPVVDTRPRMGAVMPFAYIYKKPAAKGLALGYVRIGTSVPLLDDKPVAGEGCARGWYKVAPRGYLCLNYRTTLDLNDPYYKALASVSPKDEPYPYKYAFSNGAPMYSRVPNKEEQEKEDKKYGPRGSYVQLAEWSKGHEELLTTDPIKATDPIPEFFAGGKRHVAGGNRDVRRLVWRVIPNGSMVAYHKAFEAEGRVWLLTSDLMLVPADRVRAIKRHTFHGVKLGSGVDLPLAWNRTHDPKPLYKKNADGTFSAMERTYPGKGYVEIVDSVVKDSEGNGYYELREEPGIFVSIKQTTVSRAKSTLPQGVKAGSKWIEAKILPGTLTAYEGTTPVYATLFSPGKGGVPVPGHDHTKYATTQIGYFPIEWKDRINTMSNEKGEPKVLWFSDVPHIQYLKAPLAMHVAYWHQDFSNPKSAECVNVSAEDGQYLFNFTDPPLPEGWGGIRPGGGNGDSTPVIVSAQ